MPFEFIHTELEEVILIKTKGFVDNRGQFAELYKKSEFRAGGINDNFVQDNYSKSPKGVLRGLHFQKPPYSQSKLIRCISGIIYDIAVDIRLDSPNFKKYVRVKLSGDNMSALYIPEGFAHGFVVLSDFAQVVYKAGAEYNKAAEGGIFWADKDLNIDWGIDFKPILSDKDKVLPLLKEAVYE